MRKQDLVCIAVLLTAACGGGASTSSGGGGPGPGEDARGRRLHGDAVRVLPDGKVLPWPDSGVLEDTAVPDVGADAVLDSIPDIPPPPDTACPGNLVKIDGACCHPVCLWEEGCGENCPGPCGACPCESDCSDDGKCITPNGQLYWPCDHKDDCESGVCLPEGFCTDLCIEECPEDCGLSCYIWNEPVDVMFACQLTCSNGHCDEEEESPTICPEDCEGCGDCHEPEIVCLSPFLYKTCVKSEDGCMEFGGVPTLCPLGTMCACTPELPPPQICAPTVLGPCQ